MGKLDKIDRDLLIKVPENIAKRIENKVHQTIYPTSNTFQGWYKLAIVGVLVVAALVFFKSPQNTAIEWYDLYQTDDEITEYLEELNEEEFEDLYSNMQQ